MTKPLHWSLAVDSIFNQHVIREVLDHPDTDLSANELLGWPFDTIRKTVIAKGLADFGSDHTDSDNGTLTAAQKTLLYCFINLKRHFYACRWAFEKHRVALDPLTKHPSPVVFDLGCGPGTAGLALFETFRKVGWDYWGVDTAQAMQDKARALLKAAKQSKLLGDLGRIRMAKSWRSKTEVPRGTPVLVVASYFFASKSLSTSDLKELADWIHSLRQSSGKRVRLVYLNSTEGVANEKYMKFKKYLELEQASQHPEQASVAFLKKKSSTQSDREPFLHELLTIKKGS